MRVMLAIMKEGNITRAAEKLGYVQSNITTRVRKLEQELGVQLFHRNTKGVVPTEKGLLFSQYASKILHMVEDAALAVKEPDQPCGPLAIGVVETIASSAAFIRALSDFQSKYPEVSLSLVTGTSPQNYAKVQNRELDGAFCTGEYDLSQVQVAYEIQEEVFLFQGGQDPGSSAPDVAKASWIVFPKGCPLRASIENWVQTKGAASMNMIEVSTLDTMLNCVRSGIGYALLTESVVTADDRRLRVHSVPQPYRFVTTRLISRKEQFRSKAFSAFAKCVESAGKASALES
ncbi:LysR family transcriptional regulator [Paenibacillus soyae]|uniref:LysR family transcriptional regulator n=1 Tax=Paenibacillus soyae TaxID=2969249 RepID=A0A9X2ML71_9BACL|nr:LysR family transcriptional regulator [Paenibacillus soyae]MCR2804013.1 LysR family transcriptional regulator [Paenibacillus soyae]